MASQALIKKLDPRKAPQMSRGFAALIAYITSHDYGNPYKVLSLSITSDGFVQGWDNERGSIFIGSAADLRRNLMRWVAVTGLNNKELNEFQRLFEAKVASWEHYGGKFHV